MISFIREMTMRVLRIVLLLGLFGCGGWAKAALLGGLPPTPYGPVGYRGGWSQTQLAPDRYIVYFMGTWSKEERVKDLAFLRAAELTHSQNFSHFNVISDAVYIEGVEQSEGLNETGGGINLRLTSESKQFTARLTIYCVNDTTADFEAQSILKEIRVRYNIKQE